MQIVIPSLIRIREKLIQDLFFYKEERYVQSGSIGNSSFSMGLV